MHYTNISTEIKILSENLKFLKGAMTLCLEPSKCVFISRGTIRITRELITEFNSIEAITELF